MPEPGRAMIAPAYPVVEIQNPDALVTDEAIARLATMLLDMTEQQHEPQPSDGAKRNGKRKR